MMNIIENKSFIENKISEKEIKGMSAKRMLRVFEIKYTHLIYYIKNNIMRK